MTVFFEELLFFYFKASTRNSVEKISLTLMSTFGLRRHSDYNLTYLMKFQCLAWSRNWLCFLEIVDTFVHNSMANWWKKVQNFPSSTNKIRFKKKNANETVMFGLSLIFSWQIKRNSLKVFHSMCQKLKFFRRNIFSFLTKYLYRIFPVLLDFLIHFGLLLTDKFDPDHKRNSASKRMISGMFQRMVLVLGR